MVDSAVGFAAFLEDKIGRGGSCFLNMNEISEIKRYLFAKRNGETIPIKGNLRKKILRGQMTLQSFPSGVDVLCSQVKVIVVIIN